MDKGMWTSRIISACTGPNAAVYCGKSAGAIVAGSTVETATWKVRIVMKKCCDTPLSHGLSRDFDSPFVTPYAKKGVG
jgi:peptidase E